MNLSQRKQYALKCLIEGRTNTRSYDNCFEEDDGGEVVRFLMKRANEVESLQTLHDASFKFGASYSFSDPIFKNMRRLETAKQLRDAIKTAGSWDWWTYYAANGNYTDFKAWQETNAKTA